MALGLRPDRCGWASWLGVITGGADMWGDSGRAVLIMSPTVVVPRTAFVMPSRRPWWNWWYILIASSGVCTAVGSVPWCCSASILVLCMAEGGASQREVGLDGRTGPVPLRRSHSVVAAVRACAVLVVCCALVSEDLGGRSAVQGLFWIL